MRVTPVRGTPVAPGEVKSDLAHVVAVAAERAGVPYVVSPPRERLEDILSTTDVVLDGMLGTGFYGDPKPPFDIWIDCASNSGARIVAIDVPSGLSAQTGRASKSTINADITVTMIVKSEFGEAY